MTTLFIGRNGTCKTTLLRSIVIGLCDRAEGNALLAEQFGGLIGDKSMPATITIELADDDKSKPIQVKTTLRSDDKQDEVQKQSPKDFDSPFVCAYGVSRSLDGPLDPEYRLANSTYTLFRYDSNLIYPELAVRRLQDYMGTKQYTRTMVGIKRAIGIPQEDEIDVERGGGVVIRSKLLGTVGIRAWADGHRVPFNLIVDVFSWAMLANQVTRSGNVRGILLIDEIGQHLHPTLEIDVLARVRSLFGEMQLIGTTQSPMVALGSEPEQLVSLKDDGPYVIKEAFLPNFSDYSIEDIIADDELFDADVYRPETNEMISRYRELASKKRRTSAETAELKSLARQLMARQVPEVHGTAADQTLCEIIKKYGL